MNILKILGLMTVKEHEAKIGSMAERLREVVTLKLDISSLRDTVQRQTARIYRLNAEITESALLAADRAKQIRFLTPDAEAWRAKKAKDADYEKNRRVRKK